VLALVLFGHSDPRAERAASRSAAPAPAPAGSASRSAGPAGRAAPARSAPPTVRLSAATLDADGVERRLGAGNRVALTFDDGPDPRWTPAVLDLLHKYGVTATFCVVGEHVAAHPELVRRIAQEGHALCDHTWTHDEELTSRSPAQIRSELQRTYDAVVAATGGRPPLYFRAPAGRWSPAVSAEAHRLGLRSLGWNVDPADWQRPPPQTIVSRVLQNTTARSIVLLHDGYGDRAATVAALPAILSALVGRRLTLVTP
jgi:peptidoglycan-N-acetylglucosamine deacetylase